MRAHTLIGAQIEAKGFNSEAISEINNIYNSFSKMYDCTQDELYAATAFSVATRNYTEQTKAKRRKVNIVIWEVDLSLTTTLGAEIRVAVEAINNFVAQISKRQTDRELIWRNLLLFCYQLNS